MESFGSIECFVRSAEGGSFAEAARHLSLTPAAVGKSVAKLEARLGVRLFQRSTRRLTLTEAGKRFLAEVSDSLITIQNAVANLASAEGRPVGTLKVSMGTVFQIPWSRMEGDMSVFHAMGFKTAAMALCEQTIPIEQLQPADEDKLAVFFGTEGDGLPRDVIEACDYVVKIPMAHHVDSLNVAAASAVVFWQLRRKKRGSQKENK